MRQLERREITICPNADLTESIGEHGRSHTITVVENAIQSLKNQ